MTKCACGSYAINHGHHGRDGSDRDLCDVCYWRKRAVEVGWVNLTDNVPPPGRVVLFWSPDREMAFTGVWNKGAILDGGTRTAVTHWTPLPRGPLPPKVAGGDGDGGGR